MNTLDVLKLLYESLTQNAELMGVISGVYDESAPCDQKSPYILIGDLQQVEGELLDDSQRKSWFNLHFWSSYHGKSEIIQMQSMVDAALPSGIFLFTDFQILRDRESSWWHGVATYRVYHERV